MAQPPTGNPSFFGIKVSKPGVNVNNAGPTGLVYQNDYTTETWYDSSNPRILLGQLPDSTYGMWVSQVGQNVTTATPSQLIFNSGQDIFKIVGKGTMSVSVPSTGNYSGSVAHGLSFTPAVLGYMTGVPTVATGTWFTMPYVQATAASGMTILAVFDISVDAKNVNIYVYNNNSFAEGTYTFQYYLLQETL